MKLPSHYVIQVIKGSFYQILFSIPKKFLNYIRCFKSKLKFDAWSILTRNNENEYIRMLYIGKDEIDKNYIHSMIFIDNSDEDYLGKVGILRILFYLWGFQKNYDLVVFKSRLKYCNLIQSRNDFVVPVWVSCEIDLTNDIKSSSMSIKSFKNNIRKMKKSDFKYVLSKDPVDFDFFYYNMHLPYITERHGDLVLQQSFESMQKSFENGELLLIKEGPNTVAGVIIDYNQMKGVPRLTKLGVLDGDFDYVKRGALIALYYYTVQYLKGEHHKKLSLGTTRPFFNDGVLRHKLNWGANIICETPNAFLISIVSDNKLLKSFLINSPFIHRIRNKLNLATFSDHSSTKCPYLPKDQNKILSCGLNEITYFPL